MTIHIQGPWRTDSAGGFPLDIHDAAGDLLARVVPEAGAGVAERIVACVNACEGIDTDWLEGGCTGWLNNTREERGQYQRERDELQASYREAADAAQRLQLERDELLAALEHIREYWNRDRNEQAMSDALWRIIDTADEAIAKAKGGAA